MRNTFLLILAIVISCSTAASADETLPNVILMMADDMGLGDTSAYQAFTGNSDADQIRTPNMDRLARWGVRFTDAHTPSSRCSPTRYALLTGRYAWRSRLKHWVLFGAQGDPMIEADRPTLATLMRDRGYGTAMVGKWHVGLRYRNADGLPAAAWNDADLGKPLFDTPLDHGFDRCWFTSRSHGTSGPESGTAKNNATQSVGPGHVHGRVAAGATGEGWKLVDDGPEAYVLAKLGSRHSDHAVGYLDEHLSVSPDKPFFLYYACNSNHGPYTPDVEIDGQQVAGAARSVAGTAMDVRSDFIYENDVALGRLLNYLEEHDDPRHPGEKLRENTIVIFTSDNGAEVDRTTATGSFRSNKGSVYEGGHRVPFLVAWPKGNVGDGDASTPGETSDALIGLQDLFATLAEVLAVGLPNLRTGAKGAEDSVSVLGAWRGETLADRAMIFNDHKQAEDRAAAAIRLDNPAVDGRDYPGKWKLFVDASLLRRGQVNPVELFDLATDSQEEINRIDEERLKPLIEHLAAEIHRHRTVGGHRLAGFAPHSRVVFDWQVADDAVSENGTYRVGLLDRFAGRSAGGTNVTPKIPGAPEVTMTVVGARADRLLEDETFSLNFRGLGLSGGTYDQVDDGQAVLIRFDRDVIVESAAIAAGNGACGGFYRLADQAPLQIYCIDGDVDAQDQSGILSDLGVLRAEETLRLDSSPFLAAETPGRWRLAALTIRVLEPR